MDSHDVAEQARLLSHQYYTSVIDKHSDLIEDARILIQNAIAEHGGTHGHKMWAKLLKKEWPEIREAVLRDDPEGRLLRSNSPFSHLIGITDEKERINLWRKAKTINF